MITSINEWKIIESKNKFNGVDLLIVDVQENFNKYFTDDYLLFLKKYCKNFNRVFQVFDNIDIDVPSYTFPNQVAIYDKQYGGELLIDDVEYYFSEPMWNEVNQKLEEIPDVGDIFETKYNDYWVYIGGQHKWFFCNNKLATLFKTFKNQNRKIILVGGANGECLHDIYITMLSFDINVELNDDFIYSFNGCKY